MTAWSQILIQLGQNLAMLLALMFLYGILRENALRTVDRRARMLLGLLFGVTAVFGMMTPVPVSPGIYLDSRVVMAGLAGAFGGLAGGCSALTPIILYRISLGGSGMASGIGAVSTGMLTGLLFYHFWPRKARGLPFFLLLGLALGGQSLFWILALPREVIVAVFKNTTLPILLTYPAGTIALGMLFDLNERRIQAEIATRDSEERYRAIVEDQTELICRFLPSGILTFANGAYRRTFGLESDSLEGTSYLSSLFLSDHEAAPFHQALLQTNTPLAAEHYLDGSSGEPCWQQWIYRPLYTRDGTLVEFQGTGRDITRQKIAENDKEALERQLLQRQKLESLGTLAGGIAHDFNNILQGILAYCQLARESAPGVSEPIATYLQAIEAGGHRATDLVNQILTFSKASGVEYRPTALQPVLEDALRFLRRTIPSTLSIEAHIDSNCPKVNCDATQIYQVVTNLCTNGAHAMEAGGGQLKVSLRPVHFTALRETFCGPVPAGEYIELTVTDTGTGIPPELFDRLLDPFFTTKDVGKGTGLGLATVHGIVRGISGGLEIESTLGAGTTIRVYMPTCNDSAAPNPTHDIEPTGDAHCTGHIMIVDDEELLANATALMLQRRGFTTEIFCDPLSALTHFSQAPDRFDAAIVDFMMPAKNGAELATDFHQILPAFPLLLATGMQDDGHLPASEAPIFQETIRKPFRLESLLGALNRILAAKSQTERLPETPFPNAP